jgi:hypothetical protein
MQITGGAYSMTRTQTIDTHTNTESDEMLECEISETEHGLRHSDFSEPDILSIIPNLGVINVSEKLLRLKMTPETVHLVLGKPERTLSNMGPCKHLTEHYFNRGLTLRYWNVVEESSYLRNSEMGLYEIMITERNGWQVEIDGVSLFDDNKLQQMKSKFKYTESKRKMAVAFPTLGILTVGCVEKETGYGNAKEKRAFFCDKEAMRYYIYKINMWD